MASTSSGFAPVMPAVTVTLPVPSAQAAGFAAPSASYVRKLRVSACRNSSVCRDHVRSTMMRNAFDGMPTLRKSEQEIVGCGQNEQNADALAAQPRRCADARAMADDERFGSGDGGEEPEELSMQSLRDHRCDWGRADVSDRDVARRHGADHVRPGGEHAPGDAVAVARSASCTAMVARNGTTMYWRERVNSRA